MQLIAAENLDQGCTLIEKAATDKAVRDMDIALDVALGQRSDSLFLLYSTLALHLPSCGGNPSVHPQP